MIWKNLWHSGWIGSMIVMLGVAAAAVQPDGDVTALETSVHPDSVTTRTSRYVVVDGDKKIATESVARSVTLTGLVYDDATSKPLSGAKITLRPVADFDEKSVPLAETETDALGQFRFADVGWRVTTSSLNFDMLSDEEYHLIIAGVELPGYLHSTLPPIGISAMAGKQLVEAILIQQATSNAHFPVKFLDGQNEQHITIPMTKALSVSGRIVNESGVGIPHAYLSELDERGITHALRRESNLMISGPATITSAKEDGAFQFYSKPLSSYLIVAGAKDYAPSWPLINVLNRSLTDIEIVLKPGKTFTVVVTDDEGAPIAGAYLAGAHKNSRQLMQKFGPTNSQGRLLVKNLSDEIAWLRAYHNNYTDTEVSGVSLSDHVEGQPLRIILIRKVQE